MGYRTLLRRVNDQFRDASRNITLSGISEKKNLSKAMLPHWQSVKYEITTLPLARVFVFQIFSRVETILESELQ